MKIAIIEDELPALNRLKKIISEIAPEAEIAFVADSIASAITKFQSEKKIDLALFDIELADGQSFEIFKQTTIQCPIIFTTAYDEFALRAFKLNSIDYLLKPIDKDELSLAIIKYKALQYHQIDYKMQLQRLVESFQPQTVQYKSRFLIKSGTKLLSIAAKDVACFQAADKVVYLYPNNGQKYIVDHSLEELNKMLDPEYFFQLNRQFIANLDAIHNIHHYFNGKLKVSLTLPFDEEIIVSRDKAADFKKWLDR